MPSLEVKLQALKGGASRKVVRFYIVPLDPVLKDVAWGVRPCQRRFGDESHVA